MDEKHAFKALADKRTIAIAFSLLTVAFFWNLPTLDRFQHRIVGGGLGGLGGSANNAVASWCPLYEPPPSLDDGLDRSNKFGHHIYVLRQVERLRAAVKVPTESYDDNGDVDVDPRWHTFDEFHETLRHLFPLVHEKLTLDKVNKYALLYTFPGASEHLKPVLFAAHQDVVPATSISKWTHPPYDGYYDRQFLWGRGSSDCKNNLIGILSVVEDLLAQNWRPKRTILLAFGFDEETGGERGAAHLGTELEKRYGKHGLELIVDEGGMGLETVGNYVYAMPGVAEKGYVDIILRLDADGGHSSRPPKHNGIGMMAEMIIALEDNPFKPRLTRENPYRGLLECQVKYTPEEVEPWLKSALEKNEDGLALGARLAESRGRESQYSFQTSQAVDIIHGGNKINQLPESVTAAINYRIALHDSADSIKQSVFELLKPLARKHGLAVDAFGERKFEALGDRATTGTLTITSELDLSPAPISPTGADNSVWRLFASTVRQVFEDTPILAGKTVVPVGDIQTGNTDTIHYWNLTQNIYRFSPSRTGTRFNAHTVDEKVDMLAHAEGMRFYYDLIRNFDDAAVGA
ncbi:carboxypeptidase S [Saccharata proteae CBS 121410]|uniref:Carboxypeptidase S n=1 Tax=Saccharata proteae CBS 121410 TaxID=1314787 RepID=A0A9P4HR72_9PEZI|nr:carboxypeptidase S [Saccharata proteae CBS 121410]